MSLKSHDVAEASVQDATHSTVSQSPALEDRSAAVEPSNSAPGPPTAGNGVALGPNFNPENPENQFQKFHDLPAELRIMIWEKVPSFPRIIQVIIAYNEYDPGEARYKNYHRSPKFISNNRVPPILHVNMESRKEALMKYKLSFAVHTAPATIYFNKDVDTVYFVLNYPRNVIYVSINDYFDVLVDVADEGIRYLATDIEQAFPDYGEKFNLRNIGYLTTLEELSFCVERDFVSMRDERGDLYFEPLGDEEVGLWIDGEDNQDLHWEEDDEPQTRELELHLLTELVKGEYGPLQRDPPEIIFRKISRLPKA